MMAIKTKIDSFGLKIKQLYIYRDNIYLLNDFRSFFSLEHLHDKSTDLGFEPKEG